MAESGIYEIVNLVNGKRYVGSSVDIQLRWKTHRRDLNGRKHANRHLQASWLKHGADAFAFRVLEICDHDRLIEREQSHLDSGYDYNLSPTAGSILGLKRSEESKARQRGAGNPFYGKQHSPATRAAIGEKQRRAWSDPKHVAKMKVILKSSQTPEAIAKRVAKFPKSFGPETREKVSAASLKKWRDPNFRAKRAKALAEAYRKPEIRAQKSEASKRMWSDPIKRANIIASRSGLSNGSTDLTVYTLVHADGRTISGIQLELKALCGISPAGMTQLIKGQQQTTKGWRLASS